MLLPCNVVVYATTVETHIAAVDAEQMLSIVGNDELAGTASEVRAASVRTSSTAPLGAEPARPHEPAPQEHSDVLHP